jgi:hypothetical protein
MRKKLPFQNIDTNIVSRKFARVSLSICLLAIFLNVKMNAQPALLGDLNGIAETRYNEFKELTRGPSQVYFIANTALWRSNGTPATTAGIKNFKSISNLTIVGSTLYFAADDWVSGVELWKSNGTC